MLILVMKLVDLFMGREGSILIVDSTQGVEAQTLANVYQALDMNHEIIPILNKIDLPASDLDRTTKQIEDVIGIELQMQYLAQAKLAKELMKYWKK